MLRLQRVQQTASGQEEAAAEAVSLKFAIVDLGLYSPFHAQSHNGPHSAQ